MIASLENAGSTIELCRSSKQVAIKTLQSPTPSHILFMPLRCLILLEVFSSFLFFFNSSVTMETEIGGGGSGYLFW